MKKGIAPKKTNDNFQVSFKIYFEKKGFGKEIICTKKDGLNVIEIGIIMTLLESWKQELINDFSLLSK